MVDWLDSSSLSGWQTKSVIESHRIDKCLSVGFLVSEDADQVILAQSKTYGRGANFHEVVGELIAIPKFAIISMEKLVANPNSAPSRENVLG